MRALSAGSTDAPPATKTGASDDDAWRDRAVVVLSILTAALTSTWALILFATGLPVLAVIALGGSSVHAASVSIAAMAPRAPRRVLVFGPPIPIAALAVLLGPDAAVQTFLVIAIGFAPVAYGRTERVELGLGLAWPIVARVGIELLWSAGEVAPAPPAAVAAVAAITPYAALVMAAATAWALLQTSEPSRQPRPLMRTVPAQPRP